MEAKLVFTLLLLAAATAYTFAPLDVNVVYSLDLLPCVAWLSAVLLFLAVYHSYRRRPVYLIEFACYKPGDERMISRDSWLDMVKATGSFDAQALDFLAKIVKRSGLGDQTYMPPVHQPPPSMADGQAETVAVMFGCLDALFSATAVDPRRTVRVIVVNSSLFSPTPSLTSMIVNYYKMREDVKVFNLSGMGCSAGLIAVDLAWRVLQVNPDCCAVVFSTENITLNGYFGNDRSMLLSNCIFRLGGAAALLSNRHDDAPQAKYRLLHTVRTHTGAADRSFASVYQHEDDNGNVGVSLARDLMAVAGDALRPNITTLGPLILPLTEQLKYLKSILLRRIFPDSGVRLYVPDFRRAIDHFCVHAGGKAVLEEMQRSLDLEDVDMEPCKCTLHRFGNTSSSSPWYELAYAEANGKVRRGHRVWQIGLGAGFICNSVVWRALRDVPALSVAGDEQQNGCNPWTDSVESYPEKAYNVASL